MQVRWLKKALLNLEQAYQYISVDNLDAAVKTIMKIQAAVNQLASFPIMGKVGRVAGTRELVIGSTPYFVVYRVKGERVEILRILHGSRKYPE
ncbi:type II toxin-antitoxin system mRNA interferase toxin, RelE/StbE family [Scytonema sp. UIC 10036]|uniref:type II toxin-antitoxin system RelE/ParE family toxin n=1 Tax=Scytonema sp. UIC 10036 TaxID=2304196 RepID=UPI0012DA22F9|nr:type II toxin-antitoxin system RelE/ParE family toxin [Scytonema sp. UIC 10036]MUG95218.1 type II toxin-antitoxin system mRNA interferase toxin, RelE/StbE family [Scytonema sp. UIC 10036]